MKLLYTCDACARVESVQSTRGIYLCDNCNATFASDWELFEKWHSEYRRQVFDSFAIELNQGTSPDAIIQRLESTLGRTVRYDREGLFEALEWWYVPESSIGCSGFIVDKRDENLFGLGSAIHTEQHFKNYDAGFRHDLLDLTITEVFDYDNAVEFLLLQKLWHNPRSEVVPDACPSNGRVTEPCIPASRLQYWSRTELATTLHSLPATFRSQRLHIRPFIDPAIKLPFSYSVGRGT